MLKMHFKNELLPESYNEFGKTIRPDESNMKKLLLFAGRSSGITVPELLRTICDKTGIRSNQLGKIICRADKTFINANPEDAEKILKAFAKDKQWRFKYDEPRELRNKKSDDRPRPEKKKKVKTHKPLREEFFKWIAESE